MPSQRTGENRLVAFIPLLPRGDPTRHRLVTNCLTYKLRCTPRGIRHVGGACRERGVMTADARWCPVAGARLEQAILSVHQLQVRSGRAQTPACPATGPPSGWRRNCIVELLLPVAVVEPAIVLASDLPEPRNLLEAHSLVQCDAALVRQSNAADHGMDALAGEAIDQCLVQGVPDALAHARRGQVHGRFYGVAVRAAPLPSGRIRIADEAALVDRDEPWQAGIDRLADPGGHLRRRDRFGL